MSRRDEIDELERRRELARQMGGPDGVAFQHGRGKLTVRERFDRLQDPGTFEEIGTLAGTPQWGPDGELVGLTPSNYVVGRVDVDGRPVFAAGGDFTIRGGASDASIGSKYLMIEEMARQYRVPFVRLLDATGGSVRTFEQIGYTYVPDNPFAEVAVELLQEVPVVSMVLGSVAGLPAVQTCLCHFNVMVKGTSQVFVAGPAVVEEGTGVRLTKEELGDERVQIPNGVVDNLADTEDEAFELAKRFLSYLPSSVWEMPPRAEPTDPPDRRDEYLLDAVPQQKRRIYDTRRIIDAVVDRDSFFEIAPMSGRSTVTGLARIDGYPVGLIANDPKFYGGAMDIVGGGKATRLAQLCDVFHLPLVWLADEPGFHVGPDQEKLGIVRAGARATAAFGATRMPMISFVIRQLYGVAGGMHVRHSGMYRRYAWPSAHWGSMHIEGGAMVAYRREIQAADDPDAKRAEIEARLEAIASPLRSAHAFNVEEIVDPRETRPILARFVTDAQRVLQGQVGRKPGLAYLP